MSFTLHKQLARVRIAEALIQALLRRGKIGLYDYSEISASVERASSPEEFLLKKGLEELIAAQKEIVIPKGYFNFLNKVNERAFSTFINENIVQEMLDKWEDIKPNNTDSRRSELKIENPILTEDERHTLDTAGLTYKKNIECMNLCSFHFHNAWQAELRVTAQHHAMVVEVCADDDKMPENELYYSIHKSTPSYKVGRWNRHHLDLRSLWSLAIHEPEHYHQALCSKVVQECCSNHKETIKTVSIIFYKGSKSYPPSIFFGAKDKEIRELGLKAYLTRPKEITAYYAHNLMELTLSRHLKMTPPPHVQGWLFNNKPLTKHLPSNLVEGLDLN